MEVVMNNIPLICALVGVIGVLFSIILATVVKSAPAGDEKMQEIATAIKEGAIAYLNRQMKSMGIAGIVIFIVIFATMGAKTAIGFLVVVFAFVFSMATPLSGKNCIEGTVCFNGTEMLIWASRESTKAHEEARRKTKKFFSA